MAILIGVIALGIGLPAIWLYNRLIGERNQVRQGYADIDVQLTRRADLVPRLVEVVKAYAGYEKALLTAVTELRAKAANSSLHEKFTVERELGKQLQNIVLLQEAYPQLKADTNFRDLSARLVEVEEQLQYARRFYNGAVKQYVTHLESFPDVMVARLFRFQPMPFFEADERENAKVQL